MSIGDGLARADEAGDQAGLALEKLEELISEPTKLGGLLEPVKIACLLVASSTVPQLDFAAFVLYRA